MKHTRRVQLSRLVVSMDALTELIDDVVRALELNSPHISIAIKCRDSGVESAKPDEVRTYLADHGPALEAFVTIREEEQGVSTSAVEITLRDRSEAKVSGEDEQAVRSAVSIISTWNRKYRPRIWPSARPDASIIVAAAVGGAFWALLQEWTGLVIAFTAVLVIALYEAVAQIGLRVPALLPTFELHPGVPDKGRRTVALAVVAVIGAGASVLGLILAL